MRTQARVSVRKSDVAKLIRVLREHGLEPTSAEISPDGAVRVLTGGEIAREHGSDDAAFDAWWAKHGKKN